MSAAAVLLALSTVAASAPEVKPLTFPEPSPHHRAVVVPHASTSGPSTAALVASAWAFVGASVADAVTTEIGVRTDGVAEGNPFMRGNAATRLAVKAGSAAGFLWLTQRMGNRRAALWMRIRFAALHGVVVVRNIQGIQGASPLLEAAWRAESLKAGE